MAGEGITAVVSLVAVSLSLAAVVTVNRRRANTASDRRLASHRALAEVEYFELHPEAKRLAAKISPGGRAVNAASAQVAKGHIAHDNGVE